MASLLAEEQSVIFQREQHNFSGIGKIAGMKFYSAKSTSSDLRLFEECREGGWLYKCLSI